MARIPKSSSCRVAPLGCLIRRATRLTLSLIEVKNELSPDLRVRMPPPCIFFQAPPIWRACQHRESLFRKGRMPGSAATQRLLIEVCVALRMTADHQEPVTDENARRPLPVIHPRPYEVRPASLRLDKSLASAPCRPPDLSVWQVRPTSAAEFFASSLDSAARTKQHLFDLV